MKYDGLRRPGVRAQKDYDKSFSKGVCQLRRVSAPAFRFQDLTKASVCFLRARADSRGTLNAGSSRGVSSHENGSLFCAARSVFSRFIPLVFEHQLNGGRIRGVFLSRNLLRSAMPKEEPK